MKIISPLVYLLKIISFSGILGIIIFIAAQPFFNSFNLGCQQLNAICVQSMSAEIAQKFFRGTLFLFYFSVLLGIHELIVKPLMLQPLATAKTLFVYDLHELGFDRKTVSMILLSLMMSSISLGIYMSYWVTVHLR